MASFNRPEPAFSGLHIPSVLHFMSHWTECLHGEGMLRDTLGQFGALALADVVHLHRVNAETGAQRSIASFDAGAATGARPLTRALGLALVGHTPSRAKPGTLWSLAELDRDDLAAVAPRSQEWMAARGFAEAMLIPLSAVGEKTDLLEFYLKAPLDRARRQAMETLATAMAAAWQRRPEGRIARILRAAPAISQTLAAARPAAHPLSDSNPFGFTAAELRICSLIRASVGLNDLGCTLGVAESTLRSHLGKIFAKAGVAGQVGLVRLLLEPEATPNALRA